MTIILPALAVAFAAVCVWLAVRIVNRGERWAKWTASALILMLAYPLSFGPACAMVERSWLPMFVVAWLYDPLIFTDHSAIQDYIVVYANKCGGPYSMCDLTQTKAFKLSGKPIIKMRSPPKD